MKANHSKKPIRERGSTPLYNFAQPHTLQTKEFLSFWIANSAPPPLKASLFLSFQTVQKHVFEYKRIETRFPCGI